MNIWNFPQMLKKLRGLLSSVPSKIVQIFLIFGITLLTTIAVYDVSATVVSKDTRNYITFTDWCLNKESLQPDTKALVNHILDISDISDCNQASQKLLEIKH